MCFCRPKRLSLFLLDLVITDSSVHYSTPLDKFETALVGLFDKGIEATKSIPQLEGV